MALSRIFDEVVEKGKKKMQIMIDLDEELYNYIHSKRYDEHLDRRFDYQIRFAVRDGIPFPKGHGRIADMDAAIKCIEEVEGEDAIRAIGLIEWACGKRTLLEADAESEVNVC